MGIGHIPKDSLKRIPPLHGMGRSEGTTTNSKKLEERFQTLADDVGHFSSEVTDVLAPGGRDRSWLATRNLEIVRTVFGKWCIEIFVVLCGRTNPLASLNKNGDRPACVISARFQARSA